jgi:hypothetical protein
VRTTEEARHRAAGRSPPGSPFRAEREVAYDREFRLSPLVEALDKAAEYGITVVSMRRDWKTVFDPAEGRS